MATYSNFVPQVDYTTRDYSTISAELENLIQYYLPAWTNRDPSDFGITLLELFAYMGDQLHYYIDRAANEAFLTTASQRRSVLQIANLLNYSPSNSRAAHVNVTFSNSTSAAITVPALTQVSTTTVVNAANQQIVFETDVDVIVPAATSLNPLIPGTYTTTATEGQTVTSDPSQISDGLANQQYQLLQSPVIDGSISVAVDGVPYTYITNLIDASATDPVFSAVLDSYGNSYVVFGDNTSGRIPPINAEIVFQYRVGSGSAGNVAAGSIKKILNLNTSGISVAQSAAAYGGADQESTDSIRINAPRKVSTLNRVVSLKDYKNFATTISGVDKANAVSSVYTSVQLYVAQQGDPGVDVTRTSGYSANFDALAPKIVTAFSNVSQPNVSITVLPPTYVSVDVSVNVNVNSKRRQTNVQNAVKAAITNLLYFPNLDFAVTIKQDDLRLAISQIDGVDSYTITLLNRTGNTGVIDVTTQYFEYAQAGTITVTPTGGIV